MKTLRIASVVGLSVFALAANAQAQFGRCILSTLGGVELRLESVDVSQYGDYIAAKLTAKGVDPAATLVTFTNISITGNVVQTHSSFLPDGNALGRPTSGPLYGDTWADLDTHLLISNDMIAGGVFGISETNDASRGMGPFRPLPSTAQPVVGLGDLAMDNSTDAFFVLPEFQRNEIEVAYIVIPASSPGHVSITLGVLGSGIMDAGTEGGASFGYDGGGPISTIICVPEPASGLMAAILGLGLLWLRRCN